MKRKANLYDALVGVGLNEDQLGLIADDPEVAREVAGMVMAALDRRRARSVQDRGREPPKSGNYGTDNYFW